MKTPGGPSVSRRRHPESLLVVVSLALTTVWGCSGSGPSDPAAERGRQVYLAQCIACHNTNPAQPGAVGPPVRGSSKELLEAKIVNGAYPPGYTPKRPTRIMPPQPALGREVPSLAAFLK